MSGIRRREFLAAVAGAAAGISSFGTRTRAGEAPVSPESAADIPAPPQVPLGKTGITLSRVGQGTGMRGGNRQSDHTRMGFEKLVGLFRHDYERGVTFFDMADLYGSHVYFREALRSIPRDKVAILTKLWWRYDGDPTKESPQYQRKSAWTALERFRHELSTDYLDIVLLHCLMTRDWEKQLAAYMDVLAEAKEKKIVRAVGVSCHDFGAMEAAARSPWLDVLLARINPFGAKMDGPVDKVVEVLRETKKNGKAVIGMKIYGEGTLAGGREGDRKEECIRYVQNLGLIDTMTVGATSTSQMDDTLRLIAKYPAAKVG